MARWPPLAPSPDIPSSSRANFNIPHPFHPPGLYPEYKPYHTELEMAPRDSRTFYSNMDISDAEEEEEKKDEDGKVEEVDAEKEKDTNRPLLLGKFEMQCTRLTGGLKEEAIQAKISDEGKLPFHAYEVFDKISIRSYKIQKMRKLELSQAKKLVQTLEVCTATRFGSLGLVDSITNSGLCQVHYALSSSSVEPVNISVRNHKIKHKKKRILSPKTWMFKYKKEESEDWTEREEMEDIHEEENGTDEEVLGSSMTMEQVAVAKQYIEHHYKAQNTNLHDRKERHWILERKLAFSEVPKEEQINMIKDGEKKETEFMRLKRNKISLKRNKITVDDFELLTIIGRGAVGAVRLCWKTKSGNIYAMKKLKKSEMVMRRQVQHVRAERNLLAEVANYYIVKLYYSFQDAEYLYLITEYVPGGDMMTLLVKDTLREYVARFYIAQSVLAIESIHRYNYIHRDITPDNLLLGKHGHMKLSDFGFCRPLDCRTLPSIQENRANDDETVIEPMDVDGYFPDTDNKRSWRSAKEQLQNWQMNRRKPAFLTVGTPANIAPEVLLKKGKIIHWRNHLIFPEDAKLSREAKDLICRLLCSIDHRLGTGGGAHQIKDHPWFKDVVWAKLYEMKAAYKPEVYDELDTQNFIKFDEVNSPAPERTRSAPVPAHRTSEMMFAYATSAHSARIQVIIAGAVGAAHLPVMVASFTLLKVTGIPVLATCLNGVDSLLSLIQMLRSLLVANLQFESTHLKQKKLPNSWRFKFK